ncbi:type I 3-dehydroquinate dehydratase [Georgenia sp. EYE_87]|uniref:type I 3-dehydroquinate dehydratase n=1 Tax=Georgenia sp. EYE_87 TaxID=2853448 RepID=UPI002005E8C1|nr:type I 3-dehydroquinate dehydratase [Georgenia sp. EYE_87]MCK6212348.1 type I 3-dehydroquinate dehydratase [Georgenia sp. EYE_87]
MSSRTVRTVRIGDVTIGRGAPAVIVPVLGRTTAELREQAAGLGRNRADVVEWRVDHFGSLTDIPAVLETAHELSRLLSPAPLLVTCRTSAEGGSADLDPDAYGELLTALAASGTVDLLDVEYRRGDVAGAVLEVAHRHAVPVIASNHDFTATPPAEEIVARLCAMQDLGADVAKIAVMPRDRADVLTLLTATRVMFEEHARIPIVTMAMGPSGAVSRIAGHVFGSAATFAASGTTSAPGQLDVDDVRTVLEILERAGAAAVPDGAA